MVPFHDFVGVNIAPVSKKTAVKWTFNDNLVNASNILILFNFQMAKTTIHVLTMNSNVGPHYVKTRNAYLMTRFAIRKRTVPTVIDFLLNFYLAAFKCVAFLFYMISI